MTRPDWDNQFAETTWERQNRQRKARLRAKPDPFTDPTKAGTIFEDHRCSRCDSGNKPCIKGKGHERECDTLYARND